MFPDKLFFFPCSCNEHRIVRDRLHPIRVRGPRRLCHHPPEEEEAHVEGGGSPQRVHLQHLQHLPAAQPGRQRFRIRFPPGLNDFLAQQQPELRRFRQPFSDECPDPAAAPATIAVGR